LILAEIGDIAKKRALVINDKEINIKQFEHTFATMRANIEMNLTLEDNKQYGAINVQEKQRECVIENDIYYDIVEYKITGMLKKIYAKFIQEYKDGYGHDNFDLKEHFKQREQNTLIKHVKFYFKRILKDKNEKNYYNFNS